MSMYGMPPFFNFCLSLLAAFQDSFPEGFYLYFGGLALSLPARCCLVLGLEREGHHYYCFSPQVLLLFVASFLELQDMAGVTRDTVQSSRVKCVLFVCARMLCLEFFSAFPSTLCLTGGMI